MLEDKFIAEKERLNKKLDKNMALALTNNQKCHKCGRITGVENLTLRLDKKFKQPIDIRERKYLCQNC